MRLLTIPPLDFTNSRPREFNEFSDEQRECVVYGWIVEGKSTRQLDSEFLCPGKDYRGYKSMGILHYLGLRREHQGIFKGVPIVDVLASLMQYATDPNYCMIFYYIRDYVAKHGTVIGIDESSISNTFPKDSLKDQSWIKNTWTKSYSSNRIDNRLMELPDDNESDDKTVKCKDVTYHYSSKTIKESLKCLYDFRCQICGDVILRTGWNNGLSRVNQWIYLNADVHHILPLSKHGPDKRANMLCLCPTCHRKFHTGEFELKEVNNKITCIDQLLGHKKVVNQKHQIILF